MKRTILYLIFALLPIYCSSQPNKQADKVRIMFEIRPEVNYVTHLYTLAGLGFSDEEYTTKYGNTLPKAAIDTLKKYKDPCRPSAGCTGEWHAECSGADACIRGCA